MQKRAFSESEADKWFDRNITKIEQTPIAHGFQYFTKYIKSNNIILEIGCASGHNIAYLSETKNCTCYGIDPSEKAIEYGQTHFPKLILSVGTADSLPYPNETFDWVILGFCLYLVDRSDLIKVISEADRVLKNPGFLGIIDFDSRIPKKRPYRHYPGLFSYKMDYSQLFLVFPHYNLVDRYSYSHTSNEFTPIMSERLASVILFKDLTGGYSFEEDS